MPQTAPVITNIWSCWSCSARKAWPGRGGVCVVVIYLISATERQDELAK